MNSLYEAEALLRSDELNSVDGELDQLGVRSGSTPRIDESHESESIIRDRRSRCLTSIEHRAQAIGRGGWRPIRSSSSIHAFHCQQRPYSVREPRCLVNRLRDPGPGSPAPAAYYAGHEFVQMVRTRGW
jgi:hypothetical protein